MKYLVTGGCGFLGSNLAKKVLENKDELVVFDNLSRLGSEKNLAWLKSIGDFKFVHGDIRNVEDIQRLIQSERPEQVFHLAGQVAMTTSLLSPRTDFEINALGSFNLLDSIRKYSPETAVIYSSTNKVYGDLEWAGFEETATRYFSPSFPKGFPESIKLDFQSPYGCSKGCADQYMLDFNRLFGVKTVVFRHSSMYGGRQFSTFDQGWIGWFCQKALETKSNPKTRFTISGNGKQVRDVLHADDMTSLYFAASDQIDQLAGQAFNIGGGIDNSLSLLELFSLLEKELNLELNYDHLAPRESDQKVFVADIDKSKKLIGWEPKVDALTGVKKMIAWLRSV